MTRGETTQTDVPSTDSEQSPIKLVLGERPTESSSHPILSIISSQNMGAIHTEEGFNTAIYHDVVEDENHLLTTTVRVNSFPGVTADEVGYVGELQIKQLDNRAHLWDLDVNEEYRRNGVGTFLFDVFRAYVREADVNRVSGYIRNEGGAALFFREQGIPSNEMEIVPETALPEGESGTAVAIGAGSTDPEIEAPQAFEQYDGFPASKLVTTPED